MTQQSLFPALDVVQLGEPLFSDPSDDWSVAELATFVGEAQGTASQRRLAVMHLRRKVGVPSASSVIRHPNHSVQAFAEICVDAAREHFFVLTLDGAHRPIRAHVTSIGTVNRTFATAREVFRPAIVDNAVAVIIGHTHPSGQLDPSNEDRRLTKQLLVAGENLGIPLLDHVILCPPDTSRFYSFLECGEM